MGNIGPIRKEREYEVIPEGAPVEEPVPTQPIHIEPVPDKELVPA